MLKAAYLLAVNIGEWLPVFLLGAFVTGLLLWSPLLNFWRR